MFSPSYPWESTVEATAPPPTLRAPTLLRRTGCITT